ncbi:MAG: response regulator [Gammaproteobacteria bacterium]|nr:response regulator [Gammaproteobacteria bacterium]
MKFLVVEDTEDSRVLLVDQLKTQGHIVESAVNGVEALEKARISPPDIIISDILMPEMDGFELCRQVKADPRLKKIPFIFYSATYTDHSDEELALALGGVRFLIKPLEPDVFMASIQEVIAALPAGDPNLSQAPQKDAYELEKMHLHSVGRKLDIKTRELEQKRLALKQSEDKFRHLVESVQDYYFFYIHDAKGVFTYLSPSIENVLGYKPEECLVHYSEYLTDNPVNQQVTRHTELCISGEEQPPYECEIVAKDGTLHWLEVKESAVFDLNGDISHVEGIAHDITERKQTETNLRRAQKMEALGKLVGGIAHDYNNMLGIILGYAELLEEKLEDQPELARYVHQIRHAGNLGGKLTRKLLSFSRHNNSGAQRLDLNVLLQDAQHMLQKTLTTRIRLVLDLADDLWMTWLDSGDFENAIVNMSINAMQAIEGSGQLVIQTRNHVINETDARKQQLKAGDYVRLTLTDTGAGMDDATKDKIFDPFFTSKGKLGTGLGLSQVYGFVRNCGGAIEVNSRLGDGTQMTLYFPRYSGSESDEEIEQINNRVELHGKETILLVDDEIALLDLAYDMLSQQGYRVLRAENGKKALEVLETESVDLLLSDVIMPGMDGYQLAAIVQEKYPVIKIQLLSGYSGDVNINVVDDVLRNNLIHKPYSSQTLYKRIRDLLDG